MDENTGDILEAQGGVPTKERLRRTAETAGAVGRGAEFGGMAAKAGGKTMNTGGQVMMKAGSSMMRAGAGLSETGVGAIVGVPLTVVGAGIAGTGAAAKGTGKAAQGAGRGLQRAGRLTRRFGRSLAQGGKLPEQRTSLASYAGFRLKMMLFSGVFYVIGLIPVVNVGSGIIHSISEWIIYYRKFKNRMKNWKVIAILAFCWISSLIPFWCWIPWKLIGSWFAIKIMEKN